MITIPPLRVLAAALVLGLGPGLAQAAPASPPSAASQQAVKEALVRRYLAAIEFERLADQMQAAMLPLMMEQEARRDPNVTDADRAVIVDVVRQVLREKFMPEMIARITPIYAAAFTEDELKAMVAFYESPVGRSITAKAPSLAPKSAQITRELLPTVQGEVMQRVLQTLCAKHGCDGKSAAPKPSAS